MATCGQTKTSPRTMQGFAVGESMGKVMQSVGEGSEKYLACSVQMRFLSTKWSMTSWGEISFQFRKALTRRSTFL